MTLVYEPTRERLRQLYNEPTRHYHNNAHISDLLGQLAQHRNVFDDPETVEAAIWFHDAIYDSTAKDNEAQSAALAADWLAKSVSSERVARIVRMIEATAGHGVSDSLAAGEALDMALFLDMDLSILAADRDRFDAYEAAIRHEYSWVDEQTWRERRAAFLRQYLARPFIFHTGLYRAEREAAARTNMIRSLEQLESDRG